MRKFSTKSVVTFADIDDSIEDDTSGVDMESGTASDLGSDRLSDDVGSVDTYSDNENIYIISDGAVYRKQSELEDFDLIAHRRRDSQAYENMMRRKSLAMNSIVNPVFNLDEDPEEDKRKENGHLRPTTFKGTRDKIPKYNWDSNKGDEDISKSWL